MIAAKQTIKNEVYVFFIYYVYKMFEVIKIMDMNITGPRCYGAIFFLRQFRLTKWSFLVHSATRNAPYIHPSHGSILELWQTIPNAFAKGLVPGHCHDIKR